MRILGTDLKLLSKEDIALQISLKLIEYGKIYLSDQTNNLTIGKDIADLYNAILENLKGGN